VYGILGTGIGWKYALWIWAYALVWFVFNDVVKMGAYRFLLQRGSSVPEEEEMGRYSQAARGQ
jgi:hypothetical protein